MHGGAVYARESLSEPREGTILTVLTDFAREVHACAAKACATSARCCAAACGRAASLEAHDAAARGLRKANVVDAGAQGFVEISRA